jgi:hypothetical protein
MKTGSGSEETEIVTIQGFVSKPEFAKKTEENSFSLSMIDSLKWLFASCDKP